MKPFPTPYTVELLPFVAGARDARNNVMDTFAEPIPWKVRGWSRTTGESKGEHANRITFDIELLVEFENPSSMRDRVRISSGRDAGVYEIVGYSGFGNSPWPKVSGAVANLKRVTG